MFTVDAVVFAIRNGRLEVLLIERRNSPYAGRLALPGGFVDENEPLDAAVARELEEETGIKGIALEPFHTFGDPGRDPRGWSISAAYLALVDAQGVAPEPHDDAERVVWSPAGQVGRLAFDHNKIVWKAIETLRYLAMCSGAGRRILLEIFTSEEVSSLYSAIFGKRLESETLCRQLMGRGVLTAATEPCGTTGPPRYRFAASGVPYI